MAIKVGDLNFKKAERMTQNDDGGGKITGYKVIGKRSNDIFYPITSWARVNGEVAFAKVFPTVNSYGEKALDEDGKPILGVDGKEVIVPDTLQGAGVFISKNAEDKNVNALVFTTHSMNDEIKDARALVSANLTPSVRLPGELDGKQLKGSKMVQLAMQPTATPPNAGETVYIVQDEGKASQIDEPLQIAQVLTEERVVNVPRGNELVPMRLKFVTLILNYELENTYDAGDITGIDTVTKRAFLRAMQAVDQGRYKGCKKLNEAVKIGDYVVNVDDIYGQLISPAEKPEAIVDIQAGSDVSPIVPSGGKVSFSTPMQFGPSVQVHCRVPAIKPGTLKVIYSGAELTDDGGQLMNGDIPVGTVDYHRALLTFSINAPIINGSKTIECMVASAPIRVADTIAIKVTDNTRSDTYTARLFPLPEPGSVKVDFRIADHKYTLRDNGTGVLFSEVGDVGIGQVDYSTGSVRVTFKEPVDLNTSVVFSFGVPTNYINRGQDYLDGKVDKDEMTPKFKKQLSRGGIQRGTFNLAWTGGKKAKDDGKGKITGDATGAINYVTGELDLMFGQLPGNNLKVSADYEVSKVKDVKNETLSGYATNGTNHRVQLEPNLRPTTVKVQFNVVGSLHPDYDYGIWGKASLNETTIVAYDDGAGNLLTTSGANAGTVDYDTGVVNVIIAQMATFWMPEFWESTMDEGKYGWHVGQYVQKTTWAKPPTDGTQFMKIDYSLVGDNDVYNEDLTLDNYFMSLTPTYQEVIVPGSVMFSFGGRDFIDREGTLYVDVDPITGSGAYAGFINYENGQVTISGWNENGNAQIQIKSLLTSINVQPISKIDFIITAAPIRSASLQILAVRSDGVRLEATADEGGVINTQAMQGYVNIKTGVVSIDFGRLVDATGKEDEPWFNPENVKDGKIWHPYMVFAETIKYNAVITRFSPIDPKILNINPSMIPINGKVQIFKAGDQVLLHEEKRELLPNNPPVGYEFNLPGERLTSAWLEDGDGVTIPEEHWEWDAITGKAKITKAIPAEYKQPITAVGAIEQENMLSDAQVTGKLTLASAINHDFSANANISGVLWLGNLQSRYTNLFEQSAWKGVWEDYRTEANVNWKYNDREYPLVLVNADAITERWALVFTNKTDFTIIGENEGVIGKGSIGSDCAPINNRTKAPYFTLKAGGWGQGHEAGHCLRFNTIGAMDSIWLLRCVIPGAKTMKEDHFSYRFRGEVPQKLTKQGD